MSLDQLYEALSNRRYGRVCRNGEDRLPVQAAAADREAAVGDEIVKRPETRASFE